MQARGQLTCCCCGRSIVLSQLWLDSAESRTGIPVECLSRERLTCKKYGSPSPSYTPPTDWGNEPLDTAFEEEEVDGFYSPWDVADYQTQFDYDL